MRRLILVVLVLALTACGFQLRGQYSLPPLLTPIAVSSSQVTLLRNLRAGIIRMGGVVSADAPLQIRIISERINRQTSTIDTRAKAAEYTLIYSLFFQLKYASGVPATAERSILLRRTYQFDNTRIVGKADEEQTLLDDMRQQATDLILAQLSRMKASDLSAESAAPVDIHKPARQPGFGGSASASDDQEKAWSNADSAP